MQSTTNKDCPFVVVVVVAIFQSSSLLCTMLIKVVRSNRYWSLEANYLSLPGTTCFACELSHIKHCKCHVVQLSANAIIGTFNLLRRFSVVVCIVENSLITTFNLTDIRRPVVAPLRFGA